MLQEMYWLLACRFILVRKEEQLHFKRKMLFPECWVYMHT